ncbi:hypothetical protein [Candidatus Electronema sp. PJ]|uniref:hypothetical protein n=1 Tax=Candidatus Electronema sp. PJ TaxID=3401572 RepID=UPI003AA9CC1D
MTKGLAFLPWVLLRERTEIGRLRLIPWSRGKYPDDLPYASLSDIDGVMAAYADHADHLISSATLIEIDNWHTGQDPTPVAKALFKIRPLIGFSALADRLLFSQNFDYCNYDTYSLVVQKYQENSTKYFGFTTRRRDGGASYIWSSDKFTFIRPYHALSCHHKLSVDSRLLDALLRVKIIPDNIIEAIEEFVLANTDSPNVPEHVELIMVKSAFERLFRINHYKDEFCRAIKEKLEAIKAPDIEHTEYTAAWHAKRPNSARLIECWAKEFCDMRGAAAHGAGRNNTSRFMWSEFYHLAFASILFPLLVKHELMALGLISQDEEAVEKLRYIELYLATNPDQSETECREHPWREIPRRAMDSLRKRSYHKLIREARFWPPVADTASTASKTSPASPPETC